ncbi:MAG: hypothetical protein Q8Q90_00835 [bacterium]|nr:hypothetical protein [bacterium]
MSEALSCNKYGELVRLLFLVSRRKLLEEVKTPSLRSLIGRHFVEGKIPMVLSVQEIQFVVASMEDLDVLEEALEEGIEEMLN